MEHRGHLQVVVQVEKDIATQPELGPGIQGLGPRKADENAPVTFQTYIDHWHEASEKAPHVLLVCMDPLVEAYEQVLDVFLTYKGLLAEAYVLLACMDPLTVAYKLVHDVLLTCTDPLVQGYEEVGDVLLTYTGLLVEVYEHVVGV